MGSDNCPDSTLTRQAGRRVIQWMNGTFRSWLWLLIALPGIATAQTRTITITAFSPQAGSPETNLLAISSNEVAEVVSHQGEAALSFEKGARRFPFTIPRPDNGSFIPRNVVAGPAVVTLVADWRCCNAGDSARLLSAGQNHRHPRKRGRQHHDGMQHQPDRLDSSTARRLHQPAGE